jgi:hypothetical protein
MQHWKKGNNRQSPQITCLGLEQSQKCGGVERVNGISIQLICQPYSALMHAI